MFSSQSHWAARTTQPNVDFNATTTALHALVHATSGSSSSGSSSSAYALPLSEQGEMNENQNERAQAGSSASNAVPQKRKSRSDKGKKRGPRNQQNNDRDLSYSASKGKERAIPQDSSDLSEGEASSRLPKAHMTQRPHRDCMDDIFGGAERVYSQGELDLRTSEAHGSDYESDGSSDSEYDEEDDQTRELRKMETKKRLAVAKLTQSSRESLPEEIMRSQQEIDRERAEDEERAQLEVDDGPVQFIADQELDASDDPLMQGTEDVAARRDYLDDQDFDQQLADMEISALQQAARQGKQQQAKSTQATYGRYQRHWVAWCKRMGYVKPNVLPSRFLLYMTHNVAKHPVDPELPKGIRPLRVSKTKDGYDPDGQLPAPETVMQYVKACFDLFKMQKADPSNKVMFGHPTISLRSPELSSLMKGYVLEYSAQLTSEDTATLNFDSGYDIPELSALMWDGWQHRYHGRTKRKKIVGFRSRLSGSWLHFMMSRGENLRMARLSDIFSHAYEHPKDGHQFTLGVILQMLRGKTNRDGKAAYGSVVRNKDVQICPVGSLALHLLERFLLKKFDPADNSWVDIFLLVGNDERKTDA
ncbi:hypothetical protein EMPS_05654 [Entomortierella parvispora]|uniref:Ndc10 domain-containing protein n=1 Tax=Entomortierella parvispora TaxID=205924 RepID=A0A9P3HAU3_9FUNG|nr:hypothetical protein EMPS_05654 [Entomortierella parvispora]